MPGRNFLFIPGPTNIPRRIQNVMNFEQEYVLSTMQDVQA